MSENTQDTALKTRPEQLVVAESDRGVALQSFLQIMGFDPNGVDGVIGDDTKAAYDGAREQYSFLPELSDDPQAQELLTVFTAIDQGLQDDVAFQRQYVTGINAEDNATNLQGALVAGGSWANEHLGDRISGAQAIDIDGDRGELTDRGVRNAASLTGVAGMQATLNLLADAGLTPNGIFDEDTNSALQAYANEDGIELTDNAQDNFVAVRAYIQENEGDTLRAKVAEVLNADENTSEPDADTLNAQIVMNDFARQAGSDVRTAPDSLQTDSQITAEMSHTRTVIAPEVGVDLEESTPDVEIIVQHYVDNKYEIVRNDVRNEVGSIMEQQASNPDYPSAVLAYSQESNGYVLVVNDQGIEDSTVYQISDQNVENILGQVADGSIALDVSAQTHIAEELHGNRSGTEAYTTEELRTAFVGDADRFTSNTKESLLTTQVHSPDGSYVTFGLDDLHDGLDHMDSKHDWDGFDNPEEIRDYVRELRQAAEDAREERPVTVPVWQHGELDDTNSVEIDLGGEEMARVPAEIYYAVTADMQRTESGFDFASNEDHVATRVNDFAGDMGDENTFTEIHLAGSFGEALAATEPLITDPMEPAIEPVTEAPEVRLAEAETTEPATPGTPAASTMTANM